MIRLLNNTFKKIVYSNVFVAIAAGFAVFSASILLHISLFDVLQPAIFIFISTFLVYNVQRVWRIEREAAVKTEAVNERIEWIYNHRNYLIIFIVCAAIIGVYYLFQLEESLLYFIGFSGVIAILYVTPIYYSKGDWRMIREIPFLKIFLVGITWALSTVYWPYLYVHGIGHIIDFRLQLVAIERFLFIFAITLPFDVRDMAFDSRDQLRTFVLQFGIKRVVRVSVIILFLLCLFNITIALGYSDEKYTYFMNSIHYILTAWIVSRTNDNRGELFYSGLIESTIILQLLLLWLSLGF